VRLGALGGVTAAALMIAASCSSTPVKPPTVPRFAVGMTTESLVDASRPTPANGTTAGQPDRTLATTVWYPATGPAAPVAPGPITAGTGATPARKLGPFPLIVFAHGFGTAPDLSEYRAILEQWAAAGYVVAAPLFPLTRGDAPGGADLSDYVSQPGDMSFVATDILRQSEHTGNLLTGLVNPTELGVAGHSLGGVTTLGLVANTCCQDPRIKAAVVMSGDPITFPSGKVDYSRAPPLLLVHGDADPTVPYVSSVDVFNAANAPKGLLTVIGGDHGSPVSPAGPAFAGIVRTTIDFFDRYLKGDAAAASRLATDAQQGATTLTFDGSPGTQVTVPTPSTVAASNHLQATAVPTQGLTDGQAVTVQWRGYAPGVSVNVLQCSKSPPTSATDCDLHSAKLLQPDPAGNGSVSLVVHTTLVGAGTCDAAHPGCVIAVNQGGSLSASATVIIPISFAP
jgi:dienelactone hydrolase